MSRYLDKYIDEEGNIDNELTINTNGFACLTNDIESIIDKYTGIEGSGFDEDISEIRMHFMDLIHMIANNRCDVEGYEMPYTGGDSALSPDDLEEVQPCQNQS